MFQVKKQGAVDVVCCGAALCKDQVDDFEAAVEQCVSVGQPMLILDLSEVPLVDSIGLEALLNLQDRIEHLGGNMKLAAVKPLVGDALKPPASLPGSKCFPRPNLPLGALHDEHLSGG